MSMVKIKEIPGGRIVGIPPGGKAGKAGAHKVRVQEVREEPPW